jgi:hypothetical protein
MHHKRTSSLDSRWLYHTGHGLFDAGTAGRRHFKCIEYRARLATRGRRVRAALHGAVWRRTRVYAAR